MFTQHAEEQCMTCTIGHPELKADQETLERGSTLIGVHELFGVRYDVRNCLACQSTLYCEPVVPVGAVGVPPGHDSASLEQV